MNETASTDREDDSKIELPSIDTRRRGCKSECCLQILIVGGGLGGLAAAHCLAQAGHDVTVLESEPGLKDVGAGLQVSPNASRLLIRWGLADELARVAVEPRGAAFRRYENGELLGYARWRDDSGQIYGAPNYCIHRADLRKMLFDLAVASPRVFVRFDASVSAVYATPNPRVSVKLECGEVIEADLIIGADGVGSTVRTLITDSQVQAKSTGDAAYRIVVPTGCMKDDPELKALIDDTEVNCWMGPQRHMIAYCMRAKQEYNMAMVHERGAMNESWSLGLGPEGLLHMFSDFEPRVRKLLALVERTHCWKLMDHEPLERWTHPQGRVVLLGDACHPMLPYRAQGAAMALEDAAVLGSLLSRLSSKTQLYGLLSAYEKIRHPRTRKTQISSRMNQHIFHLSDGPEQERRDAEMRKAWESELKGSVAEENGGNANQWADKRKNIEQFTYDADALVEQWWKSEGMGKARL